MKITTYAAMIAANYYCRTIRAAYKVYVSTVGEMMTQEPTTEAVKRLLLQLQKKGQLELFKPINKADAKFAKAMNGRKYD